eukprot:TRINITY_DN14439_c0_g1_i2.p1 TRINITY_DN14439_c0_g1~~TRINITY_DN14439_c0_g1_i2.p1  ORF type:complete len:220 (-),score=22.84 TRINITY_DN14439_c0_g1_i2:345-920(-)
MARRPMSVGAAKSGDGSLQQRARRARIEELQSRRAALLAELSSLDAGVNRTGASASLSQLTADTFEEADYRGSCSGQGSPNLRVCYKGRGGVPYIGSETISMYFRSGDFQYSGDGSGSVNMRGSGQKRFSCDHKHYWIRSQQMTADFGYCMPDGIEIKQLTYCKDENYFKVSVYVRDVHMNVHATLKQTHC